jgi:hypothetical protein
MRRSTQVLLMGRLARHDKLQSRRLCGLTFASNIGKTPLPNTKVRLLAFVPALTVTFKWSDYMYFIMQSLSKSINIRLHEFVWSGK